VFHQHLTKTRKQATRLRQNPKVHRRQDKSSSPIPTLSLMKHSPISINSILLRFVLILSHRLRRYMSEQIPLLEAAHCTLHVSVLQTQSPACPDVQHPTSVTEIRSSSSA